MSVHPDDDALSAALDGEDDDAASHASSCSTCASRLEELRAASALVATAVATPPLEARELAVANAVAAARVAPDARHAAGERWRALVVAAAAVVLVAGVVAGAVGLSNRGGPTSTATGARAADRTTSAPGAAGAGTAGGLASSAALASNDLGDVPDADALRQRLADALAHRSSAAAPAASATNGSPSPGDATAEQASPACPTPTSPGTHVVYRATLVYAGRPADVVVLGGDPSTASIAVVTARSTCQELARVPVGT